MQALSNAMAATIGLGNISGVAVAITQGGAGAIFWMWVAALFGMNTKFFECSLALIYRGKDYKGDVQGGPMYVIEKVWGQKGKWLSVFFAICALVGTLSLFQINQLTDYLNHYYELPRYYVGILFSLIVYFILKGGVVRIGKITSRLVPIMTAFYFLSCFGIILMNFEAVPMLFAKIFTNAFHLESVLGGVLGYSFKEVVIAGVKRATFSNEAGIGTAPMAHANAKTNEPIREGYVAMLGPFFDTIIICSLTAISLLLVNPQIGETTTSGIIITNKAFEVVYGGFGVHLLGVSILLFSFSTMIGMANYNEKCWNYLFKGKKYFSQKSFLIYYCTTIIMGALVKMSIVINIMDICFALMAIPNILITVYKAKEVQSAMVIYNKKYGITK